MPASILTRINTNQITDQSVTGVKVAFQTLTGGLFAPDLSMASNVTIAGNLVVEGVYTYSNIASVNTQVADPLIVLNNGFLSAPYADQGLVMERGLAPLNVAFIWNEVFDRFELIYTTETGGTYGTINNSGYANLQVYDFISNSIVTNQATFSNVTMGSISGSNIYLSGNAWIDSTDESYSTITGAFVTRGGVGIAKNTNIGGNLSVGGNLIVLGNVTTVSSQEMTVEDSIITLHTYGNLAPLTVDDGRYIGVKARYWKSGVGDRYAFFGWNNSNQNFEYYSLATESVTGNIITGTLGTGKFGSLLAANTTISTNTTTGALIVSGGAGIAGNLHVGNGAIINSNRTSNDFILRGVTESTLMWVNSTTGQMVFGGNATSFIPGSKLTIDANTSMIPPSGTTANRPGSPVAGMLRYNTSLNILEFYNGTKWKGTVPEFTIIVDQQFTADGNTSVFTLNQSATQNSIVVSINGIMQFPGLSYTVSDTTLTMSENPRNGDIIDVRTLITTTMVTEMSSLEGHNQIMLDSNGIHYSTGTTSAVERWIMDTGAGNLVPSVTSNLTIGNVTRTVQNIYADTIVANAFSSSGMTGVNVGLAVVPLDQFPTTLYRSAKYFISVTESTKYSAREVILLHDGSTTYMEEYGNVTSGFGNLITLSSSIFSGNVFLSAVSNTGNINNIVKIQKSYLPV